ncbi:hypothetical protein T484DRAFT_1936737 [Baffinella frigidus]|nr:hypothetical protein T484DRAFT_1936737 [Cryptophyta sp. CCMP2293]
MHLVGALALVASSPKPSNVGLQGMVVRETANTLVLADGRGASERRRTIPKRGAVINVAVAGRRLISLRGDNRRGRLA